ncbi:MAG: hypothetical protein ABSD75_09895 [Terriglobales bacterium]|jgi:hypothetical protein
MVWKWLLAPMLIVPLAGQVLGQNNDDGGPPPSLGEVAKKNKDTSRSKAKRVFTDDEVSVRKSPIPAIALEGPDNTQAVLDTIHEFKATHDAAETERVVHEWFDEQSEVLASAIEANNRIAQHNQIKMEAAQDGYGGPYGGVSDGDYNKLRQRQLSEMWAQRSDARSNRDNWQVVSRIQGAFGRVRCDAILNRGKAPYDWFRIRNANGVGTY